ncbi:MAG: hypothetical protein HIU92_02600 [Proteobacteria bacterium]|nr:hypothetical protein [Pseudomonadota bacterium]
MDAVETGYREATDSITGTLPEGSDARPDTPIGDDIYAAPLTRHYRVAAINWRRKEPNDKFRVRGRASVMILELGMIIHNVGVAIRSADDAIVISMPPRVTITQSTQELAVEFRDSRAHNIFARRVWSSILGAFPDAETSPLSIKITRNVND